MAVRAVRFKARLITKVPDLNFSRMGRCKLGASRWAARIV